MPAEPVKGGPIPRGADIRGGLELVEGMSVRTYSPSFSRVFEWRPVDNADPTRFIFYRQPGIGPVR